MIWVCLVMTIIKYSSLASIDPIHTFFLLLKHLCEEFDFFHLDDDPLVQSGEDYPDFLLYQVLGEEG